MSTTEINTLTKTNGRTIALRDLMNMSPSKPTHCRVTALELASSGSQTESPIPNATPHDAYGEERGVSN